MGDDRDRAERVGRTAAGTEVVQDEFRVFDDERGRAFVFGFGEMMVEDAGGLGHPDVEDEAARLRSDIASRSRRIRTGRSRP